MTKLNVLKSFAWAHQGVTVQEYIKGDQIETDDEDLIRVAVAEDWATAQQESSTEVTESGKADVATTQSE